MGTDHESRLDGLRPEEKFAFALAVERLLAGEADTGHEDTDGDADLTVALQRLEQGGRSRRQ